MDKEKIKTIPATIIINGVEMPIYHAITKKQMIRVFKIQQERKD